MEPSTPPYCRGAGYQSVLYFTDRVGTTGPIAVHAIDLPSRRVRQVTYPPSDHWGDSLVRVAPDGATLAVARTRALGVTDVFTVSVNDSGVQQLTFDQLKVHGLDWSGDGEQLFYSSNRGGGFGLWQRKPSRTHVRSRPPPAGKQTCR